LAPLGTPVHAKQAEIDTQRLAGLSAMSGPGIGGGLQAVVDVDGDEVGERRLALQSRAQMQQNVGV
jgi:hypothetical protein